MTTAHTPPITAVRPGTPSAGVFGMALFLAALTMLFLAGILAFAFMRTASHQVAPTGSIDLPVGLWFSTGLIVLSSFTIQRAVSSIARERQQAFKSALAVTAALALAFVGLQTPGLIHLLDQHHTLAGSTGNRLYAMIFFLVLVHAAHVIGGLVPLGVVLHKALRGGYDHEQYAGVRYLSMYWHFLDAVWLFMFAALLVLS